MLTAKSAVRIRFTCLWILGKSTTNTDTRLASDSGDCAAVYDSGAVYDSAKANRAAKPVYYPFVR